MWKLWIIVVAFIAQNIVPSDADYPCDHLNGKCIKRNKNCCPQRMTDGAYYCADETYACCLDYPKTFHYDLGVSGGGGGGGSNIGGSGSSGAGATISECQHRGGLCVATKEDCNCTYVDRDPSLCPQGGVCCIDYPCGTRHVDGMCLVERFYAIRGTKGEQWTPLYQIPDGCEGKKILRDPACPGKSYGCIRHKILNLLECMHYTCPSDPAQTEWLSVSELVGPPDLCDGKGVIIYVPDRCYGKVINDLKQMCKDVGGTPTTFTQSGEKFLKCLCSE